MKNEVNRVLVAEKKNLYLAPVTELQTMSLVSNLLAGSAPSSDIGVSIDPADPTYPNGGD